MNKYSVRRYVANTRFATLDIFNNCVLHPKDLNKIFLLFSSKHIVGQFKMAATGQQVSYNRYTFSNKRHKNT